MSYLRGDFDDAATYEKLSRLLAKTGQHSHGNHLYYLATPPGSFAIIPKCLSAAGLLKEQDGHWRRIIIEKPFGTSLHSAEALNRDLLSVMSEGADLSN